MLVDLSREEIELIRKAMNFYMEGVGRKALHEVRGEELKTDRSAMVKLTKVLDLLDICRANRRQHREENEP